MTPCVQDLNDILCSAEGKGGKVKVFPQICYPIRTLSILLFRCGPSKGQQFHCSSVFRFIFSTESLQIDENCTSAIKYFCHQGERKTWQISLPEKKCKLSNMIDAYKNKQGVEEHLMMLVQNGLVQFLRFQGLVLSLSIKYRI